MSVEGLNILPGIGFPSVSTLVLSPLLLWDSLSWECQCVIVSVSEGENTALRVF